MCGRKATLWRCHCKIPIYPFQIPIHVTYTAKNINWSERTEHWTFTLYNKYILIFFLLLVAIFSAREIVEKVTITEGYTWTLTCTKDFYDGKNRKWSREDGTPVFNKRRVLTKDAQLQIKDISIVDAGVYICENAPQIRHKFIVHIFGRSMWNNPDRICWNNFSVLSPVHWDMLILFRPGFFGLLGTGGGWFGPTS